MHKKAFNILDHISADKVIATLERLGQEPLTKTAHGFRDYGAITIKEAANQSTLNFTDKFKLKPAIGLIAVVLAANREYNKVVEPKLDKIEREKPDLKDFTQLSEIISTKSKEEFFAFWGHKDDKKFTTLKNVLSKIAELKNLYPNTREDFELMNKWGANADVLNYKNDVIGSISNVAVATFQHLRMVFGVDTVKPDQRVKEVLDYEFGIARLPDEKAIKAVEQIAAIAGLKVITVDQLFVKYGSGYYNQRAKKVKLKQIVKNLKSHGADNEIISKATYLSLGQVQRL